ncbi:hypothetical protein EJ110_NYTH32418 [Nymphaea thermarum]|nr:hypothetical protein EJ110_NYTH32418 [Nymphaea thermarum]
MWFRLRHAHLRSSAEGQSLTGNQTIISSGGIFGLVYFSHDNRTRRYYVGIWYKKVSVDNLLWVANRDSPLLDSKAEFKISRDGNLAIQASTNLTATLSSRVAVLLDNGNLELRDQGSSSNRVAWTAPQVVGCLVNT